MTDSNKHAGSKKYLKDHTEPAHIVDSIDLKFDIHDDYTDVTSYMQVHRNHSAADDHTPLEFDSKDLEIRKVVAGDMVLLENEYEADETCFRLNRTPDRFTLEIETRLYPDQNTSLEGLYSSGSMLCTQCEAEGFRKITPFPDRPDVMATYSCTIIADKTAYPVLLSNGNPAAGGDLQNGRHYVRWEDPFKKPSYLFALVAGDLARVEDTFQTRSGKTVDIHVYVEKENIDKCGHAVKSLKQAMQWDEERFGREYDLNLYQIVAVNDFNAGAMENKGLNIFNSRYVLADYQTATDSDFLNIQTVIAHEYFHNWTGNRITLKNWFQLSLKEGLTVFRDQEFTSDLNSRGVKRILDVKALRADQFPEDDGPMVHPVRPESYIEMNNFYTMTVYEKGAEIIRMMYTLLGSERFKKGMDLYFDMFDGCAVTIEDFLLALEKGTGTDLSGMMLWYTQSGTPAVSVARNYDKESRTLKLTFTQYTPEDRNQSVKKPFPIPVVLGLLDRTGNKIPGYENEFFLLTSNTDTVEFKDVDPDSIPSVFRNFSAPVKVRTDLSEKELSVLMAGDSDLFNRWNAATKLYFKEFARIVDGIKNNREPQVSMFLIYALEKLMQDRQAQKMFVAETLTLPGENEIGEQFETVDVQAVHKARKFLRKEIAAKLETFLMEIIDQCEDADPKSLDFEDMSKRRLKNTALGYIGALETDEAAQNIYDRFSSCENMTDEIAMLHILADIDHELRNEALTLFYDKWNHDPLVLDKWFTVQAASSVTTPETMEKLSCHPKFSLENPNRVRALLGAFAMQNPINFHRQDGKGYEFITDHIIELDRLNPQIAARLASAFNRRKKYDAARNALMKKELERISLSDKISKNLYEVVSRSLEAQDSFQAV
ncbi:MAG: aminopeptidase N [Desulfobacteraceae bacterium]